jgi:hypothetical protein
MAWHGGRKMIFKLDTTSIMFIKSFEDTLWLYSCDVLVTFACISSDDVLELGERKDKSQPQNEKNIGEASVYSLSSLLTWQVCSISNMLSRKWLPGRLNILSAFIRQLVMLVTSKANLDTVEEEWEMEWRIRPWWSLWGISELWVVRIRQIKGFLLQVPDWLRDWMGSWYGHVK